jgi:hypothetical protein
MRWITPKAMWGCFTNERQDLWQGSVWLGAVQRDVPHGRWEASIGDSEWRGGFSRRCHAKRWVEEMVALREVRR